MKFKIMNGVGKYLFFIVLLFYVVQLWILYSVESFRNTPLCIVVFCIVGTGLSQPVHQTATYSVWRYQILYNTILTSWWWAQ